MCEVAEEDSGFLEFTVVVAFPFGKCSVVRAFKMNISENFDDKLIASSGGGGEEMCGPYGHWLHLLHVYYLPLISLVGIVGNCLSFAIFVSPHLKKRSSSYYLAALAIADLGFLLVVAVVQCSFNGIWDVYNTEGWCQLFVYLSSVCASLSVWLIVAFTVERFIAVRYPLRRPQICTVRRARIIVSFLVFCALTSQLYVFWMAGIIQTGENIVCEMLPEYDHIMKIVNFVDTIFTLIIPLALIVLMNAMIAKRLISFRRNIRKKQFPNSQENSCETHAMETAIQQETMRRDAKKRRYSFVLREKVKTKRRARTISHNSETSHQSQRCSENVFSTRNQYNVTKMLLIISTIFIILNLPSYVIRIWIFFAFTLFEKSSPPESLWCTQQIAMLLYYTNFSVNFILYTMCGATFRRALWKIVRWR